MGGSTGKITGKVSDAETKEPIIGVNVIIEGTNMGAAADINGQYFIVNIAPGTYTVRFSTMGYANLIKKEVVVNIDQTTRIDAELVVESIQGEEVVVVATRDLIKQDVSTNVVSINNDEITYLPVASINDAVTLQAGVDDGFVIRGGEANEVLFIMDGITLRDPRNNDPITNISLNSIDEISILKGGFNAEYGQVRSGVINLITKEGNKDKYTFGITIRYSPYTPKHFGISPFDENSMWMRPYLDPEVCWTGTSNGAWDKYDQRQYPDFDGWNEVSKNLLTNDDPSDDLSPVAAQRVWQWEYRRRANFNKPDYDIDAGFGGPIPFVSKQLGNLRFFASYRQEKEMLLIPLSRDDYLNYNGTIKLTSDINKNTKLNITAMAGRGYNVAINSDDSQFWTPGIWGRGGTQIWLPTYYIRSPFMIAKLTDEQRPSRIFCPSWYSQARLTHNSIAANLRHSINPNSFFEAKIERLSRTYLTGPIADRDTTKFEPTPGYLVDEAPFGFSDQATTGITGMFFGGHSSTARDSSSNSVLKFSVDYTNQMNFKNQIKAGMEFSYYTLNLDFGYINKAFGSSDYVKNKENPYRLSTYIQDKYEDDGFIINAGLRLDISNPNTRWAHPENIFDEDFFSTKYDADGDYQSKKTKLDLVLSPRIGVSHPITQNSKLYFNYGHFKQMPAYEEIFRIGRSTSGSMKHYGNPDLDQALTVSYELGYDHVLSDNYQVNLSAYYNDIKNQQALTTYQNISGSVIYQTANNDSYEDIRGLEITFKKNTGNWLRGFVTYTYQVRTYGQFGKSTIFEDPIEQKEFNENTQNFYQNKPEPQPRGNANLTFQIPNYFGPSILGMKLLAGWSINMLGKWQSGQYITWNPNGLTEINNNLQVKGYTNVDIKLRKTIAFKRINVIVFADILNVLNTKRLSGVNFDDADDYRYYMESLYLPESNAYNNIVGDDQPGDYRDNDVDYQPIEIVGSLPLVDISTRAIYYNTDDEIYYSMDPSTNTWDEVPGSKMDKILEDKAYIDMPNQTSFNFLDPRKIYFGITLMLNI